MPNNSSKRGLASADKKTRQAVAREGGKASHGGGRRSSES
jgi:general stress protein YciG